MVPDVGKGGSRKDASWVRLAQRLQKDGCAVLTFDFRGCGENRGSEQLLPRFWVLFQANKGVLLPYVRSGGRNPPASLDASRFPAAYLPWLVQDIVAARHFVDTLHEEGKVNSHNLVVIAAGEGAGLTAFWLAAECRRQKAALGLMAAPGTAESRDIVAVVWIDSQMTLGPLNVLANLRLLQAPFAKERGLPKMLFVYDDNTGGAAARNKGMMKILNQRADSEKVIAGAGRAGQALLADANGEKVVLDFLSGVRKALEMRAWERRTLQGSGYVWNLGNKPVWAKQFFGTVPMPLPMDLMGFPRLPAR
jgi:pimeloyl-ACP methyl ester carboxylesterase